MKHLLLYEIYTTLPVDSISDLEIDPDWRVPQVGSKKFDYDVIDNKFEFHVPHDPNEFYDFIVTHKGDFMIGVGHYKLAKKADLIKGAGRIKINEAGKISYIDNESGHYRPSHMHLEEMAAVLKSMDLTSEDFEVNKMF